MTENEDEKIEEIQAEEVTAGDAGIISPVLLEEEMKRSMLDYAMSVITARALPDVRDGLKPVHRRILYSMHENGWTSSLKDHVKCAKVVGAVMGDYHPHGDSSIYDALVRLSQPWSLRYCAIDFHGGNGSIDGDKAAAYRYTECKLDKMADEMLVDINKNVVDMAKNFSEDKEEPIVLPSRIPFLLVNGSSGIAVGMATNMAPHNLREVVAGIRAVLVNPDIDIDNLIGYIPAPDFPTGGLIYGRHGAIDAYRTGRGKIIMRGKAEIVGTDSSGQGGKIIITEIPYMLSKENLVRKMEELAADRENGISGIADIEDESSDIDDSGKNKKGAESKIGIKIIVHVKRDDYAEVVLNQLYKMSQLQSTFGILNLALVDGRPQLLNLKQLIEHYIDHRLDVITRKTRFDLNKAKARDHILDGYLIAADNTDEVIKIIRSSDDEAGARLTLQERFTLSEIQSKAITDMRLGLLTKMNKLELENEKKDLLEKIADLEDILAKRERKVEIINEDLDDISKKYGDERKSLIVDAAGDIDIEDMIPDEDMVITMTHQGYIKRTAADTYKTQGRGGRGLKGMASKDSDFVEKLFVASAHSTILFFTDKGRCYGIKVWELPEGDRTAKGRPIVNVIDALADSGEKIASYVIVKDFDDKENKFIVQATQKGIVNRQPLENYKSAMRKNGLNSIRLDEDEKLVGTVLCEKDDNIILASADGNAVRFQVEKARATGRNAHGVRGIRLREGDEVIGMVKAKSGEEKILTVTENGYGKRTLLSEYRITNRGGKGIINIKTSERNGRVINIMNPDDGDDLLIITKNGIIIRVSIAKINIIGRNTQGVKLMNLDNGDKVIDVSDCGSSEDADDGIEKSELPQANPEDLVSEEALEEEIEEETEEAEDDTEE